MKRNLFKNHFTHTHFYIFLGIWFVFDTVLFYFTLAEDNFNTESLKIILSIITGPLAGGIIRDFQGCCWEFSLMLFPYFASVLVVCSLVQIINTPKHIFFNYLRLFLWSIGWIIWFIGSIISFGHALS